MADITIACDLGSLLSKVFYTLKSFNPELLIMESEVAIVTQKSLEEYEDGVKLGSLTPENSAWVEYKGQYRAVGFLAKERFNANLSLQVPKIELALYKILAIVAAIAQKKGLQNGASISLGVLLPYGEYQHSKLLREMISEAITNYRFRGEEKSFELARLDCRPEGFGLISRGRASGVSLKEQVIVVIVVGYRDASIYTWNRGAISKGASTELGFNKFIEKVTPYAPNQKATKLAQAICRAGAKINIKALRHLSRFSDSALRDKEISSLRAAVSIAREQYWLDLYNWLRDYIPSHVDEVILTGGTAYYYEREFNALFSGTYVNWGTQLEDAVNKCFPVQIESNGLSFRTTDNNGYFYFMCGTNENNVKRTTTNVRAN